MASNEDQAQQIIVDIVVDHVFDSRCFPCFRIFQLATQFGDLAFRQLIAPDAVDAPPLGDGHQPRAGLVRHAIRRPLFQRSHERVLGQILGQAHIAHPPGERGNELGRFDAPDRVDGAMDSGRTRHFRTQLPTPLR